jgi:hypothetical protein
MAKWSAVSAPSSSLLRSAYMCALKRQSLPDDYIEGLWPLVARYEQVLSRIGVELTDDGRVVLESNVRKASQEEGKE